MERLSDLKARHLVITCGPCKRRGIYDIMRLRRRYGDQASALDVYLRITRSCRHQRSGGGPEPDVPGTGCQARLDTSGESGPSGLPSRT